MSDSHDIATESNPLPHASPIPPDDLPLPTTREQRIAILVDALQPRVGTGHFTDDEIRQQAIGALIQLEGRCVFCNDE